MNLRTITWMALVCGVLAVLSGSFSLWSGGTVLSRAVAFSSVVVGFGLIAINTYRVRRERFAKVESETIEDRFKRIYASTSLDDLVVGGNIVFPPKK